MENRRRFPRFDNSVQVKYYLPKNESIFGYTITNDVSKGGICMPAASNIAKEGETVKLDMRNSDGKYNIVATGKVKWTKKNKREAVLDEQAGIEFLYIAPDDIDRLVKVR